MHKVPRLLNLPQSLHYAFKRTTCIETNCRAFGTLPKIGRDYEKLPQTHATIPTDTTPKPKINRRNPRWNSKDPLFAKRLQEAISKYGFKDFDSMKREFFPTFDRTTIARKVSKLDHTLKRGDWTAEEHRVMLNHLLKYPGRERHTMELAQQLNRSYDSVFSKMTLVKAMVKSKANSERASRNDYTDVDAIQDMLQELEKTGD